RLLELGEDVGDGRDAEALVGEVAGLELAERRRVADEPGDLLAGAGEDPLDDRVRLGVDRGGVERVRAAGDAQEPGGLLERRGTEPGDLEQILPVVEAAVLVAPGDDRSEE